MPGCPPKMIPSPLIVSGRQLLGYAMMATPFAVLFAFATWHMGPIVPIVFGGVTLALAWMRLAVELIEP